MNRENHIYIIAEAGVNHNGSLKMAKQLIDVAADAGADAVKFQTFKADNLVCRNAPKAEYQKSVAGVSESQYEMLKKLEIDEQFHRLLIGHCKKRRIQFLSTPFDLASVDLLVNTFKLPYLKVGSGEITNAPLLLKIARTGKKIILSTGMSTLGEVEAALGVIAFGYLSKKEKPSIIGFHRAFCSTVGQRLLSDKVVLLHCTAEYPAPFCDVNLRAMDTLRQVFGLTVGFSDHTVGIAVPVAAVALGARMIEKHFTLDRSLLGPDHKASLDPCELKAMVRSIRETEVALGSKLKKPSESEVKNMSIVRKSLVAARAIKKGDIFTGDNLVVKRPGIGISPFYFWELSGKVADKGYKLDEAIKR